jgi:peptidoglycan-associated lipoprotein
MGSGFSQRPDYVTATDSYQGLVEAQDMPTSRQITLEGDDLAMHSQAHAFVSVYFRFDNFSIDTAERPKLEQVQQHHAQNPQQRLLLVGHCDYHGTAEYNMVLGEKRAKSTRDYLARLGLAPEQLQTLSRGSLDATFKNGTPSETAADRRVDVVFLK